MQNIAAAAIGACLFVTDALGAGLSIQAMPEGLASIRYAGVEMLSAPANGSVKPISHTPRLVSASGAQTEPVDKPRVAPYANGVVVQHYGWGTIEVRYTSRGDQLFIRLRVTNTSADSIAALDLRIAELRFDTVPEGRILDAGMWGNAAQWRPLNAAPLLAKPHAMPPLVLVRSAKAALAFGDDDDPAAADAPTVQIPFTSDTAKHLTYPLIVSFRPIVAGKTATALVSLRFGKPSASTAELAEDILRRYRQAYPFTLRWKEHGPIGALFLATSQKHPPKNPRGWFLGATDVDVTTPEGIAQWRKRLMAYADKSIEVLKDLKAQGMITWDPEGEEFAGATYYGDPRLAARLAPETEAKGESGLGALDEYFKKFRDAGFRTGITLRAQHIEFENGVPAQKPIADPSDDLVDRIEYAKKRWGCTIFYIDSTYFGPEAMDADVFRKIAEREPDVLLLPENENFRYFAFSAPFNSFTHHGVTNTPPTIREAYPEAFSALLATVGEDKMRSGHDALVEAVKHGDILIVSAWYAGKHTDFVKQVYRDAGR